MQILRLGKGRTTRFRPGRQTREVHCRRGFCWVTQEGDPADHLLRDGDTLGLRRRGVVVVYGLEDAEFVVGALSATNRAGSRYGASEGAQKKPRLQEE